MSATEATTMIRLSVTGRKVKSSWFARVICPTMNAVAPSVKTTTRKRKPDGSSERVAV